MSSSTNKSVKLSLTFVCAVCFWGLLTVQSLLQSSLLGLCLSILLFFGFAAGFCSKQNRWDEGNILIIASLILCILQAYNVLFRQPVLFSLLFGNHSALFGGIMSLGAIVVFEKMLSRRSPYNDYLRILTEQGVPALLLFLMALCSAVFIPMPGTVAIEKALLIAGLVLIPVTNHAWRQYGEIDKRAQIVHIECSPSESQPVLQQACSVMPSTQLLCDLGDCYMACGDHDKAIASYQKASWMVPRRILPRYKLFEYYRVNENQDQAMRIAREILQYEPYYIRGTIVIRILAEIHDYLETIEE